MVLPALTAVSNPPASILASAVSLVLQVPPVDVVLISDVCPTHNESVPDIGAGTASTDTTLVATQPPGVV
jgi:precorrin-6B methylase 2